MATLTPNLSLRRPDPADAVNVTTDISDNMTAIDAAVAARATSAALTAHEADTTGIHGITDTTALSLTGHTHTAANITDFTVVTANRQTDSYTLVLADAGKVVEMNKATANNLTVPPNADVAFPVGTVLEVMQYGAGQTTLVAGSGVTIRSPGGKLKVAAQYGAASLRKIATNEWAAEGNLAT